MTTKPLLIFMLMIANNSSFANAEIDIQGHRGARAVLPENTIAAFTYALDVGVDTLELDTGVSKDGVVVVYHDQKINTALCQSKDGSPLPDGILIHSLTLEQIKQIDCGSKPNPRFPAQTLIPGTEIPTLAEVLELVAKSDLRQASTVRFNIETKSDPKQPDAQPEPEKFVRLLLDVIKQYRLENRVTLQSFDHRTLKEAQAQAPKIERSALYSERQTDWVAAIKQSGAQVLSPNFRHINKKDVKQLHTAGFKVIPWTANTRGDWLTLIDMQVDGIITDDPKPLLELLGRR